MRVGTVPAWVGRPAEAAVARPVRAAVVSEDMAEVLASAGFVVAFVVGAAALLGALHQALRPRDLVARSATALRELEPRGGRHRFHIRLFEVVAMASACIAGLGALSVVITGPHPSGMVTWVGGGALVVAMWWSWRRGALRAVEAELATADAPRSAPHG